MYFTILFYTYTWIYSDKDENCADCVQEEIDVIFIFYHFTKNTGRTIIHLDLWDFDLFL